MISVDMYVPPFTDLFWKLSPGNLDLIDYLSNIKWLDFLQNGQNSDVHTKCPFI